MSFFRQSADCVSTQEINTDSKLLICMDNSGSTAGDILASQKRFARDFASRFREKTIVAWNSDAIVKDSLDAIESTGGTVPLSTVPIIASQRPDFLLFLTDGQISRHSVEEFRTALLAANVQCPTVVCLTCAVDNATEKTVQDLQGVDLSIAEAFMSASQHVAIVFNFSQGFFQTSHPAAPSSPFSVLWNGSGHFARFLSSCEKNTLKNVGGDTFGAMAPFDFCTTMQVDSKTNTFMLRLQRFDRSILFIEQLQCFVDLSALSAFLSSFSSKDAVFNVDDVEEQTQLAAVFDQLCDRMVLPKLDTAQFLKLLHGLEAAIQRRCKQKEIQETTLQIARLSMQIALRDASFSCSSAESSSSSSSSSSSASEPVALDQEESVFESYSAAPLAADAAQQLQALRLRLQALRDERESLLVTHSLQQSIERFRNVLTSYSQDKTKFSYDLGSKRANAAIDIDAKSLENVGKCVQGECPVLLSRGDMCILLQVSPNFRTLLQQQKKAEAGEEEVEGEDEEEKEEKAEFASKLAKYCTRDVFVDSPMLFGAETFDAITPGVVSVEFARQYDGKHPLTNAEILGWIPLAYDLSIFRKHLCSLLCGGKEMFHVVPAYVAMIARNMRRHAWTNALVARHARYILDNLLVRCRFIKRTPSAAAAAAAVKQQIVQKAVEKNAKKRSKGAKRLAAHTLQAKQFTKTVDHNKEVSADEGVTLRESIQYQLTHYDSCLQHVAYTEACAMIDVACQMMPEFAFPVRKVLAFVRFVNAMRVVRSAYVTDPRAIAQLCVDRKQSLLRRAIASLCFRDYHVGSLYAADSGSDGDSKNDSNIENTSETADDDNAEKNAKEQNNSGNQLQKSALRCLSFQRFVVAALQQPDFGPILRAIRDGDTSEERVAQFAPLLLAHAESPAYIDFCSPAYKTAFCAHLASRILPSALRENGEEQQQEQEQKKQRERDSERTAFSFSGIDIVPLLKKTIVAFCKTRFVTHPMHTRITTVGELQQKLLQKYGGVENRLIYAEIVQKQLEIAVDWANTVDLQPLAAIVQEKQDRTFDDAAQRKMQQTQTQQREKMLRKQARKKKKALKKHEEAAKARLAKKQK